MEEFLKDTWMSGSRRKIAKHHMLCSIYKAEGNLCPSKGHKNLAWKWIEGKAWMGMPSNIKLDLKRYTHQMSPLTKLYLKKQL